MRANEKIAVEAPTPQVPEEPASPQEMTVEEATAIVKRDEERRARRRKRQREYRKAHSQRLLPAIAAYARQWRREQREKLLQAKAVLERTRGGK